MYNTYLRDLFLGTRTGWAPGAILVLLSKSETSLAESYAPEYIHNTVSCPARPWPSLGMTHNVEKGSSLWENGSAAVPQLNRSSWDQNIVRNIWISLIVQYVGISHSISDYLRYGGLCGVGGEGGSYLAWPGFPSRVSDEYANTNTHPFLCLVAGWLDLILIFRLAHNICSRLTVGERPISHSDWELLWQSVELSLEVWSES